MQAWKWNTFAFICLQQENKTISECFDTVGWPDLPELAAFALTCNNCGRFHTF